MDCLYTMWMTSECYGENKTKPTDLFKTKFWATLSYYSNFFQPKGCINIEKGSCICKAAQWLLWQVLWVWHNDSPPREKPNLDHSFSVPVSSCIKRGTNSRLVWSAKTNLRAENGDSIVRGEGD
jgi:hypothetical protein